MAANAGNTVRGMRKKVLTMAEYIEREALRNSVESIDWYNVYKGKLTAGAPNTENALYKASSIYAVIDNAPAADVAEVVHGQWYMLDDCANAGLYCSACGRRVHHEEFAYKKLKSKYCPHCGARMDRGGNGA